MDAKLQEIMQRLNRRLVDARRFQVTIARRISKMQDDLDRIKGNKPSRRKRTPEG